MLNDFQCSSSAQNDYTHIFMIWELLSQSHRTSVTRSVLHRKAREGEPKRRCRREPRLWRDSQLPLEDTCTIWGKTVQISTESSKLTLFRGGGNAILWTKRFYGHLGVSEYRSIGTNFPAPFVLGGSDLPLNSRVGLPDIREILQKSSFRGCWLAIVVVWRSLMMARWRSRHFTTFSSALEIPRHSGPSRRAGIQERKRHININNFVR